MSNNNKLVRSLALAGLLAASGASQAAITMYTTLSSFTAAVLELGTDTFDDLDPTEALGFGLQTRSAGNFTYVGEVPQSNFFGAGTTADVWLSTNGALNTMEFKNFSAGVAAFGGNIFGSNLAGGFSSGSFIVTAEDADGVFTTRIDNPTTASFLGFVSSRGSLIEATIAAVSEPNSPVVFPTINNLVLAAVPEPETYALMLAGLGLVGFMARRRRVVG